MEDFTMKTIVCLIAVIVALCLFLGVPAGVYAEGHGGGGHAGVGHAVVGHGGGEGHWGEHYRGRFWYGPAWGWDWYWGLGPWWWGYPWYSYYYPYDPYYYPEWPAVVERQMPEYSQPSPQQPEERYYWYFCPDAKNYYPYVKKCPSGWLKVIPKAPEDLKE